ncbi:hypothetical protein [Tenacibaculum sp. 190524A05c]|uniref:hypothetical protein n=1 Tax=Tenacibaculum platacis TaxID=3137852 RepID=UPI0032B10CDA
MKTRLIFYNLTLLVVLNSCCFGTKETHLGNNIYLSEYDNVDRRILYQTENCATSGTVIVPMTVLEIGNNDKWIIAKSRLGIIGKENGHFKFWVIKNNYESLPDPETVKKNTTEFENYQDFDKFLTENNIELKLTIIN